MNLKKLIEIKEKYPTIIKWSGYVALAVVALVAISIAFNIFFSFKISIYKQTIYDLQAQLYARQAEAKEAQVQRDLAIKEKELEALKRKGEEYAKQREDKRKEIDEAKKKLAEAKGKVDEENDKLGGKTQKEVIIKANELLNRNKGNSK